MRVGRLPVARAGVLLKRRVSGGYWFVAPAILYFLLLSVYPMIDVIRMSLYSKTGIFSGIANFQRAVHDPLFLTALRQTIIFAGLSALFHIGIGLMLATILNQPMNRLFRTIARSVIMLPWSITPVVVAVMWRLIYHPHLSIVPTILEGLGFNISWALLASPQWALPAVTVANIWFSLPFYMLMILAAIQGISPELYEAASMDGATPFGCFRFVTLPGIRNTLVTLSIFDIVGAFIFFDLIWIMTRGGPMNSTEVLATYSYKMAFVRHDFGYASTIALLMFLVMLVISSMLLLLVRRE